MDNSQIQEAPLIIKYSERKALSTHFGVYGQTLKWRH